MTSNLFGHAPSVSVRLVGVDNPVMNVRMKAQINDLLARNQVEVDASNGMPVTFTLSRETRDSLENARWSIVLADGKGHVKGETRHASMLPANARDTAYEATVVAALTSKLPQLKTWLGEIAREVAQ